jgi:serine/threonine protein kinase/tetratricopeptide (TPR) repeat protein
LAAHEFRSNPRFEVLTRLGQGGMGSVYQVVDRSRNVRVALKAVGRVSGDRLLRFKREYRALQEIRHPNLVELGELFELDQSWFFTMELIDGIDFLSHVRTDGADASSDYPGFPTAVSLADNDNTVSSPGRPLTPGSAGFSEARLRRGLAGLVSGVAALHAHGLVHRDIKPANVLVTDEGHVVVIDFGLVTGLERAKQSTELNVVGTVAYMSPEQAAGDPVGPGADWYAVGVILYECLTGQLPIEDNHLRLLMRKQTEVPPAPRALVHDVPADLDALCMALLEIDPRKRPAVQEIYRRLHVEGHAPSPPSTSLSLAGLPEVFVGRERELERLMRALEQSRAGQQRVVNLVGPSGVGKSALLRRFQTGLCASDDTALVLSGQCHEQESVPYKALDGVMDGLSKWLKAQPDTLLKSLVPTDMQLIAATFPVLERVKAVRAAPRAARLAKSPQEQRLALWAAVRELFRGIAEQRPTVLILEDMQWSDEDSYHLLRELTRLPDAPPLLIVYSRQPGWSPRASDGDPAEASFNEEILLHPLERNEAFALVERIWPGKSDAIVPRIVEQAEGYPFLIEALVQACSREGQAVSGNGEDVLERLFRSLSAASRSLLEVISLAGFPIPKRLAAEAAGVPPEDLVSELKALRTGRWIRTSGPLVTDLAEPSHDRVRQTVLGELDTERRAELHLAIAVALDEARAEPDKSAVHYLLGGDRHRAAQNLRRAADRALAVLAFDHAAALFGQLLDLNAHDAEEEKDLCSAWGDALASAGRSFEAAQAYLRAVPLSTGTRALDLKRRVAEQYLISGRFEDGVLACKAFLGDFGIKFPASPRAALLDLVVLRARVALRGHGFKPRQPDQLSQEELARIDALWSMAKGMAGNDLIRSQVFQTRGLLRALAAGEPYRVARALCLEYVNVVVQNPTRSQQAERELLGRGAELNRDLGSPHIRGLLHFCRGLGSYAGLCRYAEGLDSMEQGLRIFRNECRDVAWEVAQTIQVAGNTRMALGQWRALREIARDCQEAAARGDLYLGLNLRGQNVSFLALVDDRPEEAAREVELAFKPLGQAASPLLRYGRELSELRVLQYCGEVDRALEVVATHHQSLVDALQLGAPVIRLLSTEMELHNALLALEVKQDHGPRLAEVRRVIRKLQRVGAPAVASTAHGRAALALARGLPAEAITLLERAETTFLDYQREADAAAVRRRRGQLLGGDEGKALVTSAERWFVEQGVRNIPAMCRLLAPGFSGFE